MYKISTESIGDVKKYVFHYKKGDKEYGPYTYEDIADFVKKGEIGPDDYVFRFGNRKFIKASEIEELFDVKAQEEEKTVQQQRSCEGENEEKPGENPGEECGEKSVEPDAEVGNQAKGDFHIAFDNIPSRVPVKHKKESMGLKIALVLVGILAACLVVWGLCRIL